MENKERQILSEIKEMMASIRSQLEILDAKMAELQQAVDQEDADVVPIDLDLGDDLQVYPAVEDEPVPEPVAEEPAEAVDVTDDDLPFGDFPEETAPSAEEVPAEEPVVEEEPDDDLPIFAEPEPVAKAAPVVTEEPKVKQTVIDAMTDRQAWRTDMPGTQVKDIRSAISLNDRILFINYLFNEDPMAFQEALTKINQMGSLDEVTAYVVECFPDWNLESDVVYRFMMAVRRKVR